MTLSCCLRCAASSAWAARVTDRVRAAALAAVLLAFVVSCARQESAPPGDAPAAATDTPPTRSASAAPRAEVTPRHLQITGTRFVRAGGEHFHWRGISAFRLVEMVARGRQTEVEAYLDWAAARQLTVVRVLTMATHLFRLSPEDGLRALPQLLEMAAARGLHVEVVALADTAATPVEIDAHVKAVGDIAARHPNALVEVANEPYHSTQAPTLHDPAEVNRLAGLVPDLVPVALGSAEGHEQFSGGEYATFHFPRGSGSGGWQHVVTLAEGAALLSRWNKPLVNDEPIGAASTFIPGRRDNEPARFRAAALMSRLVGMGATFHYEGGLQAAIPAARELECFTAWNDAWTLLPPDIEAAGEFKRAGESTAAVQAFSEGSALAAFERQRGSTAWVVLLDVRGEPALKWQAGWTPGDPQRLEQVWIVTATRSEPSRNSSEARP